MNKLNIDSLALEKVTITVKDENEHIRVVISGEIDMREPSIEVLPYLMKIHEELLKNSIRMVEIDFTGLDYINSSGIKTLISWIMESKEIPDDRKYTIHIIHNPEIVWQNSTLPVLQKLFPEIKTIQA